MKPTNKMLIKAATGTSLSAKFWETEAAIRMLMNNLDPMVAEDPEQLIVYGGIGKAARNWDCFYKIIEVLRRLENNETLLIQSGKPVGVFKTHVLAPRVLMANSNLVPHWANWKTFNELDKKGLMMYGQMTAGSWIYIGSQGIIQGTYETLISVANQHFNGQLSQKWILTAGLGGMGGAQPLASVMAGASMLVVEIDPERIKKRLQLKYLDAFTDNLEDALQMIKASITNKKPVSVGLLGNAADIYPKILNQDFKPDLVTDQTSAHDPLYGYVPLGWDLKKWKEKQISDPDEVMYSAKKSIAIQVEAMLGFYQQGIPTFDYGNNIRQMAFDMNVKNAFDFPGFVPAYIRPLFCQGIGPFRWVALSGDPQDIYKTDEKVKSLFPDKQHLHQWLDKARDKIAFQGLPSRICWLGLGERAICGLAFNEMVRTGELKAPIVIGRDHLDSGSVASPNRETEAMLDGSDAVSDWPLLNALLNCASGASWVSVHHGGGVGMGFSQHAGFVIVADGTKKAAECLQRVLSNDPATGVMRHADAGYQDAINYAKKYNLDLPMLKK